MNTTQIPVRFPLNNRNRLKLRNNFPAVYDGPSGYGDGKYYINYYNGVNWSRKTICSNGRVGLGDDDFDVIEILKDIVTFD